MSIKLTLLLSLVLLISSAHAATMAELNREQANILGESDALASETEYLLRERTHQGFMQTKADIKSIRDASDEGALIIMEILNTKSETVRVTRVADRLTFLNQRTARLLQRMKEITVEMRAASRK